MPTSAPAAVASIDDGSFEPEGSSPTTERVNGIGDCSVTIRIRTNSAVLCGGAGTIAGLIF
jgi:hypothetical protein